MRGTLSLVFANVPAYERFDANDPFASRCVDEDFNRLWSAEVLDGPRDSAELRRARELRPLYDRVDFLLDLHSMSEDCPPLAMAGRQPRAWRWRRRSACHSMSSSMAATAPGGGCATTVLSTILPIARSALLVECGQHWEAAAPAVARQAALRWLRQFGMADRDLLDAYLDRTPLPAQAFIEVTTTVTIATDAFAFTIPVRGLQTIARAGTPYAIDGDTEIRTPHDGCVLIMPTRRPTQGRDRGAARTLPDLKAARLSAAAATTASAARTRSGPTQPGPALVDGLRGFPEGLFAGRGQPGDGRALAREFRERRRIGLCARERTRLRCGVARGLAKQFAVGVAQARPRGRD